MRRLATYHNAEVVFLFLLVRDKGFDDEMVEHALDQFDLDFSLHPFQDPCLHFFPSLVHSQKARLATTLDELVGLDDELVRQEPRVGLGNGLEAFALGVIQDLRRDEHLLLLNGVSSIRVFRQPFGNELLAVVLANGLGGHAVLGSHGKNDVKNGLVSCVMFLWYDRKGMMTGSKLETKENPTLSVESSK